MAKPYAHISRTAAINAARQGATIRVETLDPARPTLFRYRSGHWEWHTVGSEMWTGWNRVTLAHVQGTLIEAGHGGFCLRTPADEAMLQVVKADQAEAPAPAPAPARTATCDQPPTSHSPDAHDAPLTDTERFFYDHAGFSHTPDEDREQARLRNARELAAAERWSKVEGYFYSWEPDADASRDDGEPRWTCLMYDNAGHVVQSLGGIDTDDTHPYARVVKASLAAEQQASNPEGEDEDEDALDVPALISDLAERMDTGEWDNGTEQGVKDEALQRVLGDLVRAANPDLLRASYLQHLRAVKAEAEAEENAK